MKFAPITVTRYGTVSTAMLACCSYGVLGLQQVQVVLVRDNSNHSHDVMLVTTDLGATTAQVTERYAARWSIEVTIDDETQIGGVGRARNRLEQPVGRAAPSSSS